MITSAQIKKFIGDTKIMLKKNILLIPGIACLLSCNVYATTEKISLTCPILFEASFTKGGVPGKSYYTYSNEALTIHIERDLKAKGIPFQIRRSQAYWPLTGTSYDLVEVESGGAYIDKQGDLYCQYTLYIKGLESQKPEPQNKPGAPYEAKILPYLSPTDPTKGEIQNCIVSKTDRYTATCDYTEETQQKK